MYCVTFVHDVPQVRFSTGINESFCFPCKCKWVFVNSWGGQHPYLCIYDADNSGGLAVRHRKVLTEAL